jgi:hypothetical protein
MEAHKSYEELVREWDEKIESGREAEGLAPLTVKVSPTTSTMVSFRLSNEDFVAFNKAAKERGLGMSAFLRQAAYAVIQGGVDIKEGEHYATLDDARAKVVAAAAALEKLTNRQRQ